MDNSNQQALFQPLDLPEILNLPNGVALIRRAFDSADILDAVNTIFAAAPFRHMVTPSGKKMSVAMSNCGNLGWTSSRAGYAYSPIDPETNLAWPAMPPLLFATAARIGEQAGYANFTPDACLINRYSSGAQMGLHQDRDEKDFSQPIVSLSLGLSASFVIGGAKRINPTQTIQLNDGDAIVFGGGARLLFHGVRPLKAGHHPLLGEARINLTFRVAN